MEQEKDVKQKTSPVTWLVLIVFVIVIAVVIDSASDATGGSSENVSAKPVETEKADVKTYTDYDAYVNAQMILEEFLKSPSTAEYPVASKAVIKRYTEDGFRVESYVDSQNSFGAVVRSDWIVVFQFVDDSVKVLAVVLDGETLYKADE